MHVACEGAEQVSSRQVERAVGQVLVAVVEV